MRRHAALAGTVAVAAMLGPLSCASVYGTEIGELHWLAGCWVSDGGESGSGELWTIPAGGSMLGVNRTVRGGRTTAFEFMRITETEHGELLFIASPSGQETTVFVLLSIADDEVVFENPDHDFPQRVIYRRESPGRLLGRIEGEINGEERSIGFPMTRTDCMPDTGDQ
jgi:hypothetical protein